MENTRIYEINRYSQFFFEKALYSKYGGKALEYARERGLDCQELKPFGTGYSGNGPDLQKWLLTKGFTNEEMVQAGLFGENENKTIWFRFPKRLTLPIRDTDRNIIGFGARILTKGEPKYLNTPETAVFKKKHNMYGLDIASQTRRDYLILCEGYMDVMAMHYIGFDNAIASLGTALTESHADLISSYTKNVILMYDMDKAGKTATAKAIKLLRKRFVSVFVADLSPAKDPDELIRKCKDAQEAKELLLNRIRHATAAMEYLICSQKMDSGEYNYKTIADLVLRDCSVDEVVKIARKIGKQ